MSYNSDNWQVLFHDAFNAEFEAMPEDVQNGLLAALIHLKHSGPNLGRPYVDTLHGAKTRNLKELRLTLLAGYGALPLLLILNGKLSSWSLGIRKESTKKSSIKSSSK